EVQLAVVEAPGELPAVGPRHRVERLVLDDRLARVVQVVRVGVEVHALVAQVGADKLAVVRAVLHRRAALARDIAAAVRRTGDALRAGQLRALGAALGDLAAEWAEFRPAAE